MATSDVKTNTATPEPEIIATHALDALGERERELVTRYAKRVCMQDFLQVNEGEAVGDIRAPQLSMYDFGNKELRIAEEVASDSARLTEVLQAEEQKDRKLKKSIAQAPAKNNFERV